MLSLWAVNREQPPLTPPRLSRGRPEMHDPIQTEQLSFPVAAGR